MTWRLFDMDEIPEVPLLRPRRRKGAAPGSSLDARFLNDYPPEWACCPTCRGLGHLPDSDSSGPDRPCPHCLGMGSVKAMVRLLAGHRCVRCLHPYIPKGDAKMLAEMKVEAILSTFDPEGTNVELRELLGGRDWSMPSGLHDCETCGGDGLTDPITSCSDCKGVGVRWTPWSACDERCTHGGPVRTRSASQREWVEYGLFFENGWSYDDGGKLRRALREGRMEVEAEWRILTVHHLDGDKANLRWWNLASLCQRCHLEIQAKVVMERVYPHEHSEWFKPYAAGYYAFVYNGEDLTRDETMERLDELLGLELA